VTNEGGGGTVMGELYRYLADDHDRLDSLLQQATANPDRVEMTPYGEFRKGIVRHIAMEEKTVFPAIARLRGGVPLPTAERLHLDHGAIVALLVPPPSEPIIATLKSILAGHNENEEQDGGLYRLFENLVGTEWKTYLERLKATPEVPVLPHNEKPEIIEVTRRALERAGYALKDAG
jgi:hypothetical protein